MKNYSAIVCASVLALALSACGGGDATVDGDTSQQTGDEQVAGGASNLDAAGSSEATPAKQTPFGNAPLVTSPINGKVRSLPALTPSASVESRINSTSSGKTDPFAGRIISVRPIPPEPGEVVASFPLAGGGSSPSSDLGNALVGGDAGGAGSSRATSGAASGNAGRAGGSSSVSRGASSGGGSAATASRGSSVGRSTSVASSGGTSVSGGSTSGGSTSGSSASSGSTSGGAPVASGSGSDAALPDLAARPPIPDPALARAVEVTGVVLIGSNYQAIVKAPDEPTSRYVSAGQRLSGGRVLVKRIESQGSEPVVILEEEGVEVVRSIGAPAEGSAGDATAFLPELLPAS